MGWQQNNKLYGTNLVLHVRDAIELLQRGTEPVTNAALAKYLADTHDPKMNYARRRMLFERVQRCTAKLKRDGMLSGEQKEGMRRFKYNTYQLPTNGPAELRSRRRT